MHYTGVTQEWLCSICRKLDNKRGTACRVKGFSVLFSFPRLSFAKSPYFRYLPICHVLPLTKTDTTEAAYREVGQLTPILLNRSCCLEEQETTQLGTNLQGQLPEKVWMTKPFCMGLILGTIFGWIGWPNPGKKTSHRTLRKMKGEEE